MHDNTLSMSEVLAQPSKHRHNLKHRFEIVKSLGCGTYGKVKLAIDRKTGQKVAIKSIAKRKVANNEDLTRIRREIEIMASLKHKHIVQILEVFENKDKIILVQEYADGGELYDYINLKGKLTEKEARLMFRQIVSAVHYLHENGVVHRDLKLENILLDKHGIIKLADFGLSNTWQHNKLLHTYCGSPLYASPEIVNGRPYYGPEVDCWSLGVLLYTLVYGAMPFDGSDFHKLRKQISTGDYFKRPSKQSDASGLIARLLTVNPARRANIIDIAAHWWTNYEQKDLLAQLEVSEKRTSDYFEEDDHGPLNVVFDSNKKPKKSILKNRKISGGDSGCALSDPKESEISLVSLQSALDNVITDTKGNKTQSVKTVLLKEEATPSSNRHSISSNSSTEMLDFSYDSSSSGNGDAFPVCEDNTIHEKCLTRRLSHNQHSLQSPSVIKIPSPVMPAVIYSCSL